MPIIPLLVCVVRPLEMQDVNYPTVRFYRCLGFRLHGVDERLYDPASPDGKDAALVFALDLPT